MQAPDYAAWIGRTECVTDFVTADKVRGLLATLDHDTIEIGQGDPLPPLAHWMFTNPIVAMRGLGRDGHPARGGFLPPVSLPRRMWAGSRIEFERPLRVGEPVERRSEILAVEPKHGSTGALVFISVRHEYASPSGGRLVEFQDIVYREDPRPGAPAASRTEPAPPAAQIARKLTPEPTMLFRYSALTFNGHRIHYDLPYAREVEGYPGLVVHGPLLATLMVDLVRRMRPDAIILGFRCAGRRPVIAGEEIEVGAVQAGEGWDTRVIAGGAVASAGHVTLG
ncbi:MAG: MaoC family dehydratase N-terminal domain-containing protein [Gammaproteobacteria bacterium]